ncbi:MAG: DNA internalization-related competence protein ComEC/Rec2 [Blautia sp.]
MNKRPLCIFALFLTGIIWILHLGGVSIPGISPPVLPVGCVQEGVLVQGLLYRTEENSFYTILYIRQVSLIQNSENYPIDNIKVNIKKEETGNTFVPGMTVRVKGNLKEIPLPSNPGQFHERNYYYARKIRWYMDGEWAEETDADGNPFLLWRSRLKEKIKEILLCVASEDTGGLFCAMLLGDKKEMERQTVLRLQISAMAHCVAVSGTHLSVLGWGLFWILGYLRLPMPLNAAACSILMIQYGILTGSSASAMRAVIMFALAVGALATGRTFDLPSALALAAVFLILDSPAWILDSGFLLSFGAVASLMLVYPALKTEKEGKLRKTYKGSCSVFLGLLPIQMFFFFEVPLFGTLVNLVVLPTMGVVLISGIAGCAGAIISRDLGKFLIFPGNLILKIYLKIGEIIQQIPFSVAITGAPGIWKIAAYYGVLLLWCTMRNKKKKKNEKKGKRKEGIFFPLLLMGFLVLRIPDQNLQIHFLDVGQGDCAVLQNGWHVYMIDGGSSDISGVGRYRILPFLKWKGISVIDGVFLSHMDEDHINGVEELLEAVVQKETSIHIKNMYLSFCEEKEKLERIENLGRKAGCRIFYIRQGDCMINKNLKITCLYPESSRGESNENSQVLYVEGKSLSILFTGDLEGQGEENLERILQQRRLPIHILKVAHHGSGNSSKDSFLTGVNADIGIISCGKDNPYGHPHPDLIERLKHRGMDWYLTWERGMITVRECGKKGKVSFQLNKIMIE